MTPTAGGSISPGARIDTSDGSRFFVKRGAGPVPANFFEEEARSLAVLADAAAVRVPEVIGVDHTWLLLEWLEPARAGRGTWSELGRRLARLHRSTSDSFGWPADNYIGSLPQSNASGSDWPDFWIDRRLSPQWRMARSAGRFGPADDLLFDGLVTRRSSDLGVGNSDGPSLLHGDLWYGNVHVTGAGEAALIDPSGWYGHREVDLAMASLFGGFDHTFFEAYEEVWPLQSGFAEIRRALYQLYYVLVHVNLFGGSYVAQARSIIRRYQ